MDDLNLEELLTHRRTNNRNSSAERRKEMAYRSATATNWALGALRRVHPDDFAELLRQAKEKLDVLRGPLPD